MKSPQSRRLRLCRIAACIAAAFAAASFTGPAGRSAAEQPRASQASTFVLPESIRVALYLDSDRSFRRTTAAVTLSHPQGLRIGIRSEQGFRVWAEIGGGKAVRFSPDGYRIIAAETEDAASARSRAESLVAAKEPAFVRSVARAGKPPLYQVWIGPFSTLEEAVQEKARHSESLRVAGPLRLAVGPFATRDEAVATAAGLASDGWTAFTALAERDGRPVYFAAIGEETDPTALETLRRELAARRPDLRPTALKPPYLVFWDGFSEAPAHVSYGYGEGVPPVRVAAPTAGISVAEKNAAYRGEIELFVHRGKMAVVNELPLEQYLYSVTGSETGSGWPAEALKAQAVAARSFALARKNRYGVADVSDSTLDQAYAGINGETPEATAAVDATRGEVLTIGGRPLEALFHSNAGGMTADPEEVWGIPNDAYRPVNSPDEAAAAGKPLWYRVWLDSGETGYVRSDLLRETGRTRGGFPVMEAVVDGARVRPVPLASDEVAPKIAELPLGATVVRIGETVESNAFAWMRGPYRAVDVAERLRAAGWSGGIPRTLEVAAVGPSGRVVSVGADGRPVEVAYPDAYRGIFFGLPSGKFRIEETGRFRVLGADGNARDLYGEPGERVYAVGEDGVPVELTSATRIVTDGETVRVGTKDARFVFYGNGLGHGVGMSQWGARALAERGYDYRAILRFYYQGATLEKGGRS